MRLSVELSIPVEVKGHPLIYWWYCFVLFIPLLCISGRVMGSLSSLVCGGVGWFEGPLVISGREGGRENRCSGREENKQRFYQEVYRHHVPCL